MTKEKDSLHHLIKEMNKGEQSYFKKIKGSFGVDDSAVLRLFAILCKQEEYDEAKAISDLEKDHNADFFSVKKHHLFEELLDTLHYSRMKKNDVLWQVNRHIGHASILKEKLMFDEAYKMLHKAKKIARENELFHKENEINQQIIEIIIQGKSMTNFIFSENVESIRNEIISANKKSINAEEYFMLADRVFRKGEELRLSENGKLKQEVKQLFSANILEDIGIAQSVTAQTCYHFIMHSRYLNFEIKLDRALYHLRQLILLQSKIKRFSLRSRAAQMGNYIVLALRNKQFNEAEEMLQWMDELTKDNNDDFILTTLVAHRGIVLTAKGDDEKLTDFVLQLEKNFLPKIENAKITKEILEILHLLFCFYFSKSDIKKAYRIANKLDKEFDLHSFKNMKFNEKLLKLLCAIELKDNELVLSEIRAIKYLKKSTETFLEIEMFIFNTLEKIAKSEGNNEEVKRILKEFLDEHKVKLDADKYSFIYHGFNFANWAEKKYALLKL